MSKRSGEQSRRSYIAALKTQPARYRKMMEARDKMRLVNALRVAAKRQWPVSNGHDRQGAKAGQVQGLSRMAG